MENNFLPSKQFVNRLIVIVILIAGVFSIYKIIGFIKNKSDKNTPVKLVNVIQKVQDDGNDNGIPDWEERLWGLNPNKDGVKNKEFILNKRKELNPNADLSGSEVLTENETLSREFFAILMSLQQTGELDDEAMNAVASAISEKIVAEPIPDIYTGEMLFLREDTPENTIKYGDDLKKLIKKYENKNIGDELGFIIQGIAYDDSQVLYLAKTVAVSYRNFGQELIKIPVPTLLAPLHLGLANNYEKNAQAIEGLTEVSDNPIIGMKSIINYKNYNESLNSGLELLLNVFQEEEVI